MGATPRSIGALLTDIVGDVAEILRAEARLARAEFREELGKAKRGAVLMAAAGVVIALALGVALVAAVFALATIWPPWVAALTVAGATLAIGGLLGTMGVRQLKDVSLTPDRTVSSVKENIQWVKTRID
jgi:uncharacterized membrane protein YqjE